MAQSYGFYFWNKTNESIIFSVGEKNQFLFCGIEKLFYLCTVKKQAGVAQLVERQPSKLNVASSTLVSRSIIYEPLAQSVEHMTFNHGVTGSIPVWLTI